VIVDDEVVGRLGANESADFIVEAGYHRIRVVDVMNRDSDEWGVSLAPGEVGHFGCKCEGTALSAPLDVLRAKPWIDLRPFEEA
jgi:hypothetical protein